MFYDGNVLKTMLNKIVRTIRREKGISQNSLAKEIGIHRATLLRFERGEKDVSEKMSIKILATLGFKKEAIYRILVLAELFRLKESFNLESADDQILTLLSKFKSGNEKEKRVFNIFQKKL